MSTENEGDLGMWDEAMDEQAAAEAAETVELEDLQEDNEPITGEEKRKLDAILDIPVTISMEVGRSHISIRNLLQLNQGSVVELDRVAGEALDVLVNGTLIAHGEVVVVNDKFGIRLTDVISQVERIKIVLMKNILSAFIIWCACLTLVHAEEATKSVTSLEVAPVEVGKHVTANMDAMSMIMSLLMVLAVIVVSAMVLKRFQGAQHAINGLKIVTSLHLGSKEKLVVVQAGEKQLLLGVTPQQISLLKTLDEPLVTSKENSGDFAQSLAKLLKQKAIKTYDKQK
jgi:flagellar biosynthetic protein FliO